MLAAAVFTLSLASFAGFAPAHAQVSMAGAGVARIKVQGGATKAKFSFKNVLGSGSPLCPSTSSLRIVADGFDTGEIELDCALWKGAGSYSYRADGSEGFGLARISFKPDARSGKLKVSIQGNAAVMPEAPLTFLEVRLAVDGIDRRWCGRWQDWRANEAGRLASGKVTVDCPAYSGEAAFWATLYDTADRSDEALALLAAATADVPGDGRAQWLRGMVGMLRFGRVADYLAPSQAAVDEALGARAALVAAVPLMADDARIPGFAGAAGYVAGVVSGDAVLEAAALDEIRASITAYPEFNIFNFAGTVPGVVGQDDPLFAEAVDYLDLGVATGCSPFNNPTLCGNQGKAAHNVEGTGLLFGDILAKAGDRDGAMGWYDIARLWDDGPGGNDWRWRALLDERIATIDARIALWEDADPANDPPVAGTGAENCIFCHQR